MHSSNKKGSQAISWKATHPNSARDFCRESDGEVLRSRSPQYPDHSCAGRHFFFQNIPTPVGCLLSMTVFSPTMVELNSCSRHGWLLKLKIYTLKLAQKLVNLSELPGKFSCWRPTYHAPVSPGQPALPVSRNPFCVEHSHLSTR